MKLDYSETLERISEERYVSRDEVSARALRMFVWIAEWHIPGCISESRAYCTTKADAIDSACSMANVDDGQAPRGMRTALRRSGRFDTDSPLFGRVINTVERVQLRDIL